MNTLPYTYDGLPYYKTLVNTGIRSIPIKIQFSDNRIQSWGSCFLWCCVKGGLTTEEQCTDCLYWGINNYKLRRTDGCPEIDIETLAKEISEKYGTEYHSDYIFQNIVLDYWLIQNGVEIFNPNGLGWRPT